MSPANGRDAARNDPGTPVLHDRRRDEHQSDAQPARRPPRLGAVPLSVTFGVSTIILALFNGTSLRDFVVHYAALGPFVGVTSALLGALIITGYPATGSAGSSAPAALASPSTSSPTSTPGTPLLTRPGPLPGGPAALWFYNLAWMPVFGLLPFLSLLFPDGRLRSRRWRPVAWTRPSCSSCLPPSLESWPGRTVAPAGPTSPTPTRGQSRLRARHGLLPDFGGPDRREYGGGAGAVASGAGHRAPADQVAVRGRRCRGDQRGRGWSLCNGRGCAADLRGAAWRDRRGDLSLPPDRIINRTPVTPCSPRPWARLRRPGALGHDSARSTVHRCRPRRVAGSPQARRAATDPASPQALSAWTVSAGNAADPRAKHRRDVVKQRLQHRATPTVLASTAATVGATAKGTSTPRSGRAGGPAPTAREGSETTSYREVTFTDEDAVFEEVSNARA
jgi:hypothetical protein